MSSSDIYEVKDPPWAKKAEEASAQQHHRHHHHHETFDEVVHKDISGTHRRRSRNQGLRRFQHLMKRPEFSKKFWTIFISSFAAILGLLIIWDLFFRYPKQGPSHDVSRHTRALVE